MHFCKVLYTYHEPDEDGDGISDAKDNCIAIPNPKQEDYNKNGLGDACDNARYYKKKALEYAEMLELRHQGEKLMKQTILKHIDKSLNKKLWKSNLSLVIGTGSQVFHHERMAVKKIMSLGVNLCGENADAYQVVHYLLQADNMLADYALTKADWRIKKLAEKLLMKAAEAEKQGTYAQAITYYEQVWKLAQRKNKFKKAKSLVKGWLKEEGVGKEKHPKS